VLVGEPIVVFCLWGVENYKFPLVYGNQHQTTKRFKAYLGGKLANVIWGEN
jgi:hypothetical protein